MLSTIVLKNTFLETQPLEPELKLVRSVTCPATVLPWRVASSPCLRLIVEDVASKSTASAAYDIAEIDMISEYTTIMLRNIPNKYSQHILLAAINNRGFRGKYDFFYL